MKHLLLQLSFLAVISSYGQRVYLPQPTVNIPYLENEGESWIQLIAPERKIKSVSWKEENKRYNSSYSLNENGFLTEIEHNTQYRVGPFIRNYYEHKKFTYANGCANKIEFLDKKGELKWKREFEYFTNYKVKNNRFYKKDVLRSEVINHYNTDSTVAEHQSYKFKKGKKFMIDRYEYAYYADKQRKETRLYGKKNKLKQVWKFDCDFKGSPEVKKTNLVCRNSSIDNKGYETEVLFNTDHKGNKSKTVNVYYKMNGKMITVRSEYYRIKKGKEQKWHDVHYPDSLEPWYEAHYYFDKKGLKTAEWKFEYRSFNSNALVLKSKAFRSFRKNKMIMQSEELFNEKGLPVSSQKTGKKNKTLERSEWICNSDSLLITKTYNKKGRLRKTKRCELSYY